MYCGHSAQTEPSGEHTRHRYEIGLLSVATGFCGGLCAGFLFAQHEKSKVFTGDTDPRKSDITARIGYGIERYGI